MQLGIDASNLREGGGVTHIVELLRAANPERHGFQRVVIWSTPATLDRIEDRHWLDKRAPSTIRKGAFQRAFWQKYVLPRSAKAEDCNLLFAPGGTLTCNFSATVTMSRNMLPFDQIEVARYGPSWRRLRLLVLRWIQANSFRRANGLIFLTLFARETVLPLIGPLQGVVETIPHGVRPDFHVSDRSHRTLADIREDRPFNLIYVSHASPYKHQWHVIAGVAALRKATGWPITLDMVGPASVGSSVKRITGAIAMYDPSGSWARFHGPESRSNIQERFVRADAAVFASSCENMPNILLEKMAAGLPVACSSRGPMPEILQDAGIYFDPQQPKEINKALKTLIENHEMRTQFSRKARQLASHYSWQRCADETFQFLNLIEDTAPHNSPQ